MTTPRGGSGATADVEVVQPQHVAATPGYPMIEHATFEVPLPLPELPPIPVTIGDFGCADGADGMEPMARAIDGLRRRDPQVPIEIIHTDLPTNDFELLFRRLDDPRVSYLTDRADVFPLVGGCTLHGRVVPDQQLVLGWTAITVHWLSEMPGTIESSVFANLTTGEAHDRLAGRASADWQTFLDQRSRELVPGGQLVVVGGASDDAGTSGAEGLFELISDQLDEMVAIGAISAAERTAIFYPTYYRDTAEFLAPMLAGAPLSGRLEVVEHQLDVADDDLSYPQWVRDRDGAAFAEAYLPFVRAVTEPSFFRWLSPERTEKQRSNVVDRFYTGLGARIARDPERATCHWRTVSMRIRRT